MLKHINALKRQRHRRAAFHDVSALNDHLRQDIGFMSEYHHLHRRDRQR